jgi:alginate O-acetyltransferase complex protein AlgI
VNWATLDPDWQMSWLFLTALAALAVMMKLLAPASPGEPNWSYILSPILTPTSFARALPLSATPRIIVRTAIALGLLLVYCWLYFRLAPHLHSCVISYLAAPALALMGEVAGGLVMLLWMPSGRLLPPLLNHPALARGVADFWSRRWNLWFSDWFRDAVFGRLRRQPLLALLLVFAVSGLMHEWVINLPLYLVTGRKRFGTMMLYFLLQAAGVMIENRFLKRQPRLRILFAWLLVLGPVPLLMNEGLLRALHLWPK